ncbi:3-phosphoshikimate 1-carboxyvinyltransferase [Cryomorphaceae bacterium 1068]|nr:3-phosphoshikimate 1-carboxyvinyltransferase [Cryomorphaceae bacterium 1068]
MISLERDTTPDSIVEINLPASKSISNRALIIQYLAEADIRVENLSEADDTVYLNDALRNGGDELWMGDAGTASRFSIAYAAVKSGRRTIRGSERLSQRPMKPLIDALRSLGANIVCLEKEGYLPVEIIGQEIPGGEVEIEASVSSQFISALMLIGPQLTKGLVIKFRGKPTSLPYLAITEEVMKMCGAEVRIGEDSIVVGPRKYVSAIVHVEPDWSAASYFFSAVALNPQLKVLLKGLNSQAIQGDANLVDLYEPLGVEPTFNQSGLLLEHSDKATPPLTTDLQDNPDLAQTIAATYAGLNKEVLLTGLHTLKVKETDRLRAMVNELSRMGVRSEATDDSLIVKAGHELLSDKFIHTYGDHRMAMAFAPLVFMTKLSLEDPLVVAKSFPDFFAQFSKLGVKTKVTGSKFDW